MIFRVYYEQAGGHTHMRWFAGTHEGALGKCGDLTMRNNEFAEFKEAGLPIQWRKEARRALEGGE
jgi:hypothetical protein